MRRSLAISIILMSALALVGLPMPASQAVHLPHSAIVSDNPDDWTPHVLDGRVNAIVEAGSKVIAGGTFSQVRRTGSSQILTRNFLFAFSNGTGIIDPAFVPQLDGDVQTIVAGPDGHSVIVGGAFDTVNGDPYKKVVRIDTDTGLVEPGFKANANSIVNDLVLNHGTLYAAGRFTRIHATDRSGVAALDPDTGAVRSGFDLPFTDPLRGGLEIKKVDVSSDGSTMVAIGSFSKVAGLTRVQIAMIDLSTVPATVLPWQTDLYPVYDPANPTVTWCSMHFDTYMRDVDIDPTGTYFVVVTTGSYRKLRLCDSVTRWELSASGPTQTPSWIDWTGGDTSTSVTATGTAIYVGGHMRWFNNPYLSNGQGPGAVSRPGIGALDPVNGLPFNWNPTRKRGVGVFTMPSTPSGLFVGSDTDEIGHEFHGRVAFFPVAGGESVPANTPYSLPADFQNMEYTSGNLVKRTYDGTTFGSATTVPGVDWKHARGAFALNGKLYTGWSDGTFKVRLFNGTSFGSPSDIDLHGLDVAPDPSFLIPGTSTPIPSFSSQLSKCSGMFLDNGRLYYTVENDPRLYMRYFTPESQVVGGYLNVASTGDGVPWADVRGMTLANGKLFFATKDFKLWKVSWAGTHPTGAVTQIGGPGIDAYHWDSRGMFAFPQLVDTFPPTKPGKPTGTSSTTDSIDLSWAASSDAVSTSITYRIYRDGGMSPVGTVVSSSTTNVGYEDGGLTGGSTHAYTVDAVDAANNASAKSDASDQITVLSPDLTAPTDPGTPSGVSDSTSTIDLSWAASTDNVSTSITYRIYRDDPSSQVGTVTSSSSGTIGFHDAGLTAGSSHTYWVDAVDEASNPSNKVQSAPIQVMPIIFADDFSGNDFAKWTSVINLSIDGTTGGAAPPSARGQVSDLAGYASKHLADTYATICMSTNVNVTDFGGSSVNLLRLRASGGASVIRVYASSAGKLFIRSDVSGLQIGGGQLGSGWHGIELCGSVGTSGSWDLYRDGSKVVNSWVADTGTTAIGRVDIGDTQAKTWTANWDDVVVDQAAG